jgi:hypothetical protein
MKQIAASKAARMGLLLASLVIACSGPGAPAPDPVTVLRQAGQSLSQLHSVKADVKFGPGIAIQDLTLSAASSQIQLPDQSDTLFKVKQGDFLVDVRVVTMGGHLYLRLPFSRFTEVPPDQVAEIPDVSKLLDRQSGLPAVLPAGKSVQYLGVEQVASTDCDKIGVTYSPAQVGQLLGAVKPAGDIRTTVWVGRSDHYLRRAILSGPLMEAGKDVQVEVDLHDFNQPVTITKPV